MTKDSVEQARQGAPDRAENLDMSLGELMKRQRAGLVSSAEVHELLSRAVAGAGVEQASRLLTASAAARSAISGLTGELTCVARSLPPRPSPQEIADLVERGERVQERVKRLLTMTLGEAAAFEDASDRDHARRDRVKAGAALARKRRAENRREDHRPELWYPLVQKEWRAARAHKCKPNFSFLAGLVIKRLTVNGLIPEDARLPGESTVRRHLREKWLAGS